MILRILNFIVIGSLVVAAAWVYRIKFDSTVQAEHLAKLRGEVRKEQDKIAALRAKWGELDNPARIQELAQRFLKLKQITATQFDSLDHLPDQPPAYMRPGAKDPIGGIIEHLESRSAVTGSVGAPSASSAAAGGEGGQAPVPAPVPVVPSPPFAPPSAPPSTPPSTPQSPQTSGAASP